MPRKPPPCPACGCKKVRPIVYGEPMLSTFEAAERGELIIGGCVVTEGIPLWDCPNCSCRFGCLDHCDMNREPRNTEDWLELIATMLPSPITKRQPDELVGGDPVVVLVRIDPKEIVIMEASLDTREPARPELVGAPFAKVPLRARAVRVAKLIALAHGKRLSRYRWCPMCCTTMEPEYMAETVCHGCKTNPFYVP